MNRFRQVMQWPQQELMALNRFRQVMQWSQQELRGLKAQKELQT